jgi:hypothetical protein
MDDMARNMSGLNIKFAPPTMAMSDSPVRSVWHPWCNAVSVVEQPVSTDMLGPRRSKKWDSRFEAIAAPVPMRRNLGSESGSLTRLSW